MDIQKPNCRFSGKKSRALQTDLKKNVKLDKGV